MKQTKRIIRDQALAWITPVVFIGGLVIAYIIGYFIAEVSKDRTVLIPLSITTLWVSLYAFFGFKIVQNRNYLVIERFGEFNRIVHSGPRILCFPGLIDKTVAEGTLRNQEIELFADEVPPYKVDFIDGSACIQSKAWYRIGPKEDADIELVNEAIYNFTYSLNGEKQARERIEDVLESSFVPRLQKLHIAEALVQKDTVAENAVTPEVLKALKITGIELVEEMGFIITDIILPDEIIRQRQKLLEGEAEASKQEALGAGYAQAIVGIMKTAKSSGKEVSWETAQGIYEKQRGFETLATTGSKISFVSPDIKGIIKTMGVGDANPS